ncbi:MAG: dinitrogenase iron-molybdenum cofactor biosynthesis protein [Phyllobacteriaceae bacterium]|nr:dinitrogenase iron-molybdenum cofactor biosynthesis protein [Phyllobacteriaceae bacterium]
MSHTIAIPSDAPGGLSASIAAHFGHCEVFTLVEIDDGRVLGTSLLIPPAHEHGGCLAPVAVLAAAGVEAIVTGGMGARPLLGFLEAGIRPYFAEDCADVDDAARAFAAGALPAFAPERSCGGGDHSGAGCCGEHDHDD